MGLLRRIESTLENAPDEPMKGHVPSFQFLGVWLQHKAINLVLSIAGILQVLHKTDGEEKLRKGTTVERLKITQRSVF
jgi:hypothetical protein